MDFLGFPDDASGKDLPANARDIPHMGLIPGWERSPGGWHDNSLQYSCLEKLMDSTIRKIEKGVESLSEEIMTKNFPNLGKVIYWVGRKYPLVFKFKKKDIIFIFTMDLIEQNIYHFVPLPSAIFQATL